MHTKLMRGAFAAAGLAVAATALAVAPADAATVTQVRPTDLVLVPGTVSGTTGTAKADFLAEGIHIKTTNGSDAARGYWNPVGVPLSQVHAVDYEWFGTSDAQPGHLLQHRHRRRREARRPAHRRARLRRQGRLAEPRRRGLRRRHADRGPAGTFTSLSPCGGAFGRHPQNGNLDGCTPPGGAGDNRSTARSTTGTAASTASGKTANVVSAGYIAIGLLYDGVLRSSTFGPNQYVFTSTAKTGST